MQAGGWDLRIRWPKFSKLKNGKKNNIQSYPTDYSTSGSKFNLNDWESYYRQSKKRGLAGFGKPEVKKGRFRTFYRVTVAVALFLVVLTLKETSNPVGVKARESLKYAMTTEWDMRPAMDKAVQLGLQAVNMDLPFFNDVPGTSPVLAPKVSAEYALPVSGQVTKNYGWNKDTEGLEQFNSGIFISCDAGCYVKAARGGKVSRLGEDQELGNYVLIDHGGEDYTLYAGLDKVMVQENQQLNVETVIGTIAQGKEGKPGLHFEIRENNKLVDPLTRLQTLTN